MAGHVVASIAGRALAGLVGCLVFAGAAFAAACGGPVPCHVAGGEYRIALPDAGPVRGVYLFFHGHRGSAESQMKAAGLVEAARRRGLAFAAADGAGNTWSHPGSPSRLRDETAYVAAVLDDLDARFGFGPDEVFVGGFSQGASMAFYAVCDHPGRIAGAVTFAGVFWTPAPEAADCAGAPPLVHVHGRNDSIFPLSGRTIRSAFRQGDTRAAIATLSAAGGCGTAAPVGIVSGMTCTGAGGCRRGGVALCLHDGGHEVRADWLDEALGFLEAQGTGGRPR